MAFDLSNLLLIGSLLLILCVFMSKTTKFGIPVVILFMLVGMLAGIDGPGGISFYNIRISKFIGTLALTFILFSGGLDTRLSDIKPIFKQGFLLSTVGVIITALLTGLFTKAVTPLSYGESFLVGAVISSTDAASVFAILRTKNMGLKNNIRPLLEFESGSNDPMAYLLTLFFIAFLKQPTVDVSNLVWFFIKQFTFGVALGVGLGYLMTRIINRINLSFEGLYSVLLLGMALFAFGITELLGGNGFLAVYLSAIVLSNHEFVHKRSLIKHFDGQAWLMQVIMFLMLGMLVTPSELVPLIGIGLLFSAFIILVARPVAVFICLIKSQFKLRSKIFISWVGLRGAVPIIFAIYVIDADIPNSRTIFNLVFFMSLTSVILKGMTIPIVAKWMKLNVPKAVRVKSTLDIEMANKVKSIVIELDVLPEYRCTNKHLVELDLPQGITISMIQRDSSFMVPDGFTLIKSGDKLTVMADSVSTLKDFQKQIGIG